MAMIFSFKKAFVLVCQCSVANGNFIIEVSLLSMQILFLDTT